MCLSRLPSIVQMKRCPVQLNAVHKYSNPIESQWQKLKQRQRERKRKRRTKSDSEAVYTACPHFYQAVSGVQRGSHCRLGNSWWERRESRTKGDIWTWTVSDQMPYYDVIFLAWVLRLCVLTVFLNMIHVCQMASATCKRTRGTCFILIICD